MSDALAYLHAVLHCVSATFMPIEMEEVASFLRGEACVVAGAPSSPTGVGQAMAADAGGSTTPMLCYPHGATRWGHFIPLAIADAALVSAVTSGSLAALQSYFEGRGFERVCTLHMVPTQRSQSAGLIPTDEAALSTSRYTGDTASVRATRGAGKPRASDARPSTRLQTSAADVVRRKRLHSPVELRETVIETFVEDRHACMAAVRRWFEETEAVAVREKLGEQPTTAERRGTCAERLTSSDGRTPRQPIKTCVRRLLLLVRCCADHRGAVSIHATVKRSMDTTKSTPTASRRYRHGPDPLHLLFHELAALATLYDVRLATTHCLARPAVLLLPEDDSYGSAMLRQQLKEEVGHQYWVEMFVQVDGVNAGGSVRHGGGKGIGGGAWKATLTTLSCGESGNACTGAALGKAPYRRQVESALARGCRLAAQWGVLDLPMSALTDAEEVERASVQPPTWTGSPRAQEEALRRHASCFFLRPSNAPLCVLLMEALRRFPVLVRPAVLRHWQSTWTARHSLTDVLFAFHTALCPFTLSARAAEMEDNYSSVVSATSTQPQPTSSLSDLLQDVTDLLDAALDASFTLAEERDAVHSLSSNDFHVEQATLFMLFYEALVYQRESHLRRAPGLARVLVALYDRRCTIIGRGEPSPLPLGAIGQDGKIREAIRHLLPFMPLNLFYQRVEQVTCRSREAQERAGKGVVAYPMNALVLPLRSLTLASELQHTTLLSLLPPGESLVELQAVAERLWNEELPESWHRAASVAPQMVDAAPRPSAQLSKENFYHPRVPHAVRVLYLLTAHALHAATEAAKQVPVVQLQVICQLTDDQLLRVLRELQGSGLASINWKARTARTLLDAS